MSKARDLNLAWLAVVWITSLGLYLGARFWLNVQWREPISSPGWLVMVWVLPGLGWLAVEEPGLAMGGGRRLLAFYGASVLLLGGELLLWLRVPEKDRFLAWGLTLALAGAAWMLWLARSPQADGAGQEGLSRRAELWRFCGLLGLAAALRLWQLGELPANWWYDEINLSRAVIERVLETGAAPLYVAENVENPGMYLWAGAAVMKFFGQGVEAMRGLSAFYGFLALFPFYFLARRLLGPAWALAALAMFCCMRWTLIPQRLAFMSGFALFITLSAFYFFWRALASARWLDYLCFGMALGATLHAYTPTRLVAPLLLLFMLFRPRLFKAVPAKGWLAFGLGFLAVAGPMLAWIAGHWQGYAFRSQQVSIMNDVRTKGWSELWVSFKKHLLMFGFRGDHQARHNIHFWPQLDFLSAALFLPALLMAHLRSFVDARAAFLSLWFWIMLSAGIFSMTVEAPQGHRSILVAPMIPLACAYALSRLWASLKSSFVSGVPAGLRKAGLLALLAVPAFNAYELFGHWAGHPATWRSFSPEASLAARRALAAPPGALVLLSNLDREYQFHGYERNVFVRFFLKLEGRRHALLRASNPVEGLPGLPSPGSVLAIWGESDLDISAAFQSQFPDLPLERAQDPHDAKADYLAAEIPWERIPAIKQGQSSKPLPFMFRP